LAAVPERTKVYFCQFWAPDKPINVYDTVQIYSITEAQYSEDLIESVA
jgi:hypothetical protein